VETYTSWLALPVAGCWVTAQGCVCRLCGDLNTAPAARFQWRNACSRCLVYVDALYKLTSLPFTFTRVLLKVDDNEMSVEIQQIELLSCMAAAQSVQLLCIVYRYTQQKEKHGPPPLLHADGDVIGWHILVQSAHTVVIGHNSTWLVNDTDSLLLLTSRRL